MTNERSSFWRRYFCYLLGVAKLYNVLGGFTLIIIAQDVIKVCTNIRKDKRPFCLFYTRDLDEHGNSMEVSYYEQGKQRIFTYYTDCCRLSQECSDRHMIA